MSGRMRIALLGAGQLGGAFALALRTGDVHITAYDLAPAHAEILRNMGAADAVAGSVADAVRDADIVILATPVRSFRALAEAMKQALKPGAIVTDLGSVKGGMAALAAQLPAARVVPAHPIAGSEKSGPHAARGDVFQGKLCILTPAPGTDAQAIAAVETLWHIAGADILHMPAELHDQIYAYVSHLPHYIAFVSAQHYFDIGARLDANDTLLAQFLRIARSSPRMWTDIALENRAALLPALATYIAVLEHFAAELRMGDAAANAGPSATDAAKNLLPRLLASSLISSLSLMEKQSGMHLREFSGGGMRDIVAPAMTPPEADMEAISQASNIMAEQLDAMVARLRTLENAIGADDEPAVLALLTRCAECAAMLATGRQ